jgi:hypothetical protein
MHDATSVCKTPFVKVLVHLAFLIVVTYKNPRVFFNMLHYISNSIYCLKPVFLSKSRIISKLLILILDVFLHLLIELKDLGQQQILRFVNLLIFYDVSSTFSIVLTLARTRAFKISKNGLIC